jgi:hypothetical protein
LAHRKKKNVQYCHFPGYGFRWEKRRMDGKTVRTKVRDDEERNVMRSIVGWRVQDNPLSWDEIEAHLKNLNIINKEGRFWTEQRIRRACKAELKLQLEEGRANQ